MCGIHNGTCFVRYAAASLHNHRYLRARTTGLFLVRMMAFDKMLPQPCFQHGQQNTLLLCAEPGGPGSKTPGMVRDAGLPQRARSLANIAKRSRQVAAIVRDRNLYGAAQELYVFADREKC